MPVLPLQLVQSRNLLCTGSDLRGSNCGLAVCPDLRAVAVCGSLLDLRAVADHELGLVQPAALHIAEHAGPALGALAVTVLDGEQLEPKAIGELRPGQRLRVETPGGGGYGKAI